MMEQDYVDFCNQASAFATQAEALFADLSDDHVLQLNGLVRSEVACSPGDTVSPGYDFLATVLAEEARRRMATAGEDAPDSNVVQFPSPEFIRVWNGDMVGEGHVYIVDLVQGKDELGLAYYHSLEEVQAKLPELVPEGTRVEWDIQPIGGDAA